MFITEYSRPDTYHKEHFHKLLNDRIGFINEIDLIKESKILSKYVIDHDDIANTINEICKSVIVDKESTIECISILNEEYYSTNIDELISYDFLIKYFDSISSYNKLYNRFAEAIKERKPYEI